jgi:hypothetical protein
VRESKRERERDRERESVFKAHNRSNTKKTEILSKTIAPIQNIVFREIL